jgi:hypothetical protein
MTTAEAASALRHASPMPRANPTKDQEFQGVRWLTARSKSGRRQFLPGINHTATARAESSASSAGEFESDAMKVTGTGGIGQTGGPRGPKAAGGEGFRLPGASGPAAAGQTSGVAASGAVMGVEALLTLQDVGGPLERRRRAVGRAGRLLDVLDEIKLALLGGEIGTADLERLERALRDQRAATDDPRLEALLDEIETRAAVELAKLEQAKTARVS